MKAEELSFVEESRLRDQFALAALTGILATYKQGYSHLEDFDCKLAYIYADEALRARKRKEEEDGSCPTCKMEAAECVCE